MRTRGHVWREMAGRDECEDLIRLDRGDSDALVVVPLSREGCWGWNVEGGGDGKRGRFELFM